MRFENKNISFMNITANNLMKIYSVIKVSVILTNSVYT